MCLEIFNATVPLKVWGPVWANKRTHLRCDHHSVVDILKSRKAKNFILTICACNVWLFIVKNISVVVTHITRIDKTVISCQGGKILIIIHQIYQFLPHPN